MIEQCCAAGKSFFKKKKQPIPVNLATKDWAAQVLPCICKTLHLALPPPAALAEVYALLPRNAATAACSAGCSVSCCAATFSAGAEGCGCDLPVPRLWQQHQHQVQLLLLYSGDLPAGRAHTSVLAEIAILSQCSHL